MVYMTTLLDLEVFSPEALRPDPFHMRRVMGAYPTGVVIVSAMTDAGKPVGMAIGSFTSVSLDPPLIGFFPAKSSSSWPVIAQSGHFCVSVMGSDQQELCQRFAMSGADKFEGVRWHRAAASGAPIIEGCLAWIDCKIERVDEAGDHFFVLGRVNHLSAEPTGSALIFHRGDYGTHH